MIKPLDLNQFQDMKPPKRTIDKQEIVFDRRKDGQGRECGTMHVSAGLRRKRGGGAGALDLRVRVSPDWRTLVVDRREPCAIHVPKGGTLFHDQFVDGLVQREITLPATYWADWNEEIQAWVAICAEGPMPDVAELARKYPVKRGRKRREVAV